MSLEREIYAALTAALILKKEPKQSKIAAIEAFSQQALERINAGLSVAENKTTDDEIIDNENKTVEKKGTASSEIKIRVDQVAEDLVLMAQGKPENIIQTPSMFSQRPSTVNFSIQRESSSQSMSLGTVSISFEDREEGEKKIHLEFSNSELRGILEAKFVGKVQRERAVAEQALCDKLKANNLLEGVKKKEREKAALTSHDMLVLAIGQALEFFAKNRSSFRGPAYYTEAFQAMSKLLDSQTMENCNELLDIASKVQGHRDWALTLTGIVIIAMGCIIGLEPWVIALVLGGIGGLGIGGSLAITAVGLLCLGGIGTFIFCVGRVRDHSAELYKVEAAAEKLLPTSEQGFFGRLFAVGVTKDNSSVENQNGNDNSILIPKKS